VASFGAGTASAIADAVGQLLFDDAASRIILDLRNSASGAYEEALVATRLFVADGTLAIRQEHGDQRTPLAPPPLGTIIRESAVTPGLGVGLSFTPVFEDVLADFTAVVDTPVVLLTNFGTAGPAELFVAALAGRDRAETVGQRTAGRASEQKLVRLPDGTGLWLSRARYLTPDGEPIDRVGVVPDVAVDVALPELGEPLPEEDPILERALEAIAEPI